MAKYKAYPEYKDSGVEWLGEIPIHWKMLRHKYVAFFTKGKNPTNLLEQPLKNTLPYLSMECLRNNTTDKYALISNDVRVALEGQPLIIWDGSNAGEFVKGKSGILSSTMAAATLTYPLYSQYYWYLCISIEPEMRKNAVGMGIPHVNGDELKSISFGIPSIYEQKQVAEFLDHETAKIDNLIEKQQQLIELLKEKRQAVISHAVTKGLNPDVPMKYSGVEWLGEVPAHWVIPKLLHVTKAIGDGLHSTPEYDISTGYYFINGNNLVDGKISIGSTAKEVSRDEYNKHYVYLDKKTVLLSINGTIGNVAIYNNEKVILGKSAAYVNCGSVLDVNYLMYYFLTNESRYYFDLEVTGTTILNLSLNSIRQMKVCIPPLEEQQFIIEYCVEKQRQYNYLIDSAEMAIKVMQERRTALISAAVTGKIDVRDWVAPDTQDVEEPEETTA
ncbi:restriction endonuclease subunit S [Cronobacter dublinensis]